MSNRALDCAPSRHTSRKPNSAGFPRACHGKKGLDIPLTVHDEGKYHPMKGGTSEKAYAFNHRVEFRIDN